MQPEVLAWALLFVVGFSVVYRFFAWAGRRFGRKSSSPAISLDAAATAEKASATPPEPAPLSTKTLPVPEVPSARSAPAPVLRAEQPQPGAKPAAVLADPPRPAPASDYAVAATAAANATSIKAPVETADPEIATTANSAASSAVMSARIAAQAVRLALAPSVAATLPSRVPLKPSLATTLPPALSASPSKPAFAATGAFPDSETTPKPVVALAPGPMAAESDATHVPAPNVDEAPVVREALPSRPFRFRALRIGAELISLDIRLRESRERKVRQTPKTLRKTAEIAPAKELRVLVPKVAPEKVPARRIGRKPGDAVVLASIQSRTRLIGAVQRVSRVLSEPRI